VGWDTAPPRAPPQARRLQGPSLAPESRVAKMAKARGAVGERGPAAWSLEASAGVPGACYGSLLSANSGRASNDPPPPPTPSVAGLRI